ncbi:helix-turn-helix domain-containing protein [Nocardioides speluncae]|uniref:arsenate reductase/protein-tyrosine-phosphatase family protein n=1 Tax=Nocardioides speluncae TaxID=2670337 RepID=UPI000D68E22F|nr:helix-turn-helix domain-containing protein [Nocardioides speluncae]
MAIARRAQVYAALGDPGRLAIVDHLAVSDRSASELGQALDMPSNLLAHHLRVLEKAGVIARERSEGDRRRTYVRLRTDDPAVAAAAGTSLPQPAQVVFVCTQNSARSQLAAAAWRRTSTLPVRSAGTHPAARVHPKAVRAGRRHGLDMDGLTTSAIDDLAPGDLVVAVCDQVHEELAPGERLHWSVKDPVRVGTAAAFDLVATDILQRVDRLATALTQTGPDRSS